MTTSPWPPGRSLDLRFIHQAASLRDKYAAQCRRHVRDGFWEMAGDCARAAAHWARLIDSNLRHDPSSDTVEFAIVEEKQ